MENGNRPPRPLLVEARLARVLPGLVVCEILLLAALTALAWHGHHPDAVDRAVADAVYGSPGSTMRRLATDVTHAGALPAVVAGALLATAWAAWRFRDLVLGAFPFVAVGLASGTEHLLKGIVRRNRPGTAALLHERDFSFPSGHATGAAALALAVILLVVAGRSRSRRIVVVLAGIYAVAVAASRLVLGVHYLSDVLAGIALAGAAVLAVAAGTTVLTLRDRPGRFR